MEVSQDLEKVILLKANAENLELTNPSLLVVINNCTGLLPHEVGILDPVRVLGVATGPASSHVEDPNHLLASEHLANTPEQ